MFGKTTMTEAARALIEDNYVDPRQTLRDMMRDAFHKASGAEKRAMTLFDLVLRDHEEEARLLRALIQEPRFRASMRDLINEIRGVPRIPATVSGHPMFNAADPHKVKVRKHERTYVQSGARLRVAVNYLKSFQINGRPIAEVTAGEARAWIQTSGRNISFVERLVNGLQDEMVIGNHVTEKEAAEAYAASRKD